MTTVIPRAAFLLRTVPVAVKHSTDRDLFDRDFL
jgi:hypothetical protein